jgi:hypothetical protein
MGSSQVIIREDPQQAETNYVLAQDVTPGSAQIIAAVFGRRHRIKGMFFTLSADARVQFFSGGTPITGNMHFSATGGMVEVDLGSLVVGFLNQDITIVTSGGAANGSVKVITEAP